MCHYICVTLLDLFINLLAFVLFFNSAYLCVIMCKLHVGVKELVIE